MQPPERIYLQWIGDSADTDDMDIDPGVIESGDVTWSRERIFPADVEYVLKLKGDDYENKTNAKAKARRRRC